MLTIPGTPPMSAIASEASEIHIGKADCIVRK
jgi:hypothetical protein